MGDPLEIGEHTHGASSQYGVGQYHVHGSSTPVTVDTTAKSGIKEQKKSETESERIAGVINQIVKGLTQRKAAKALIFDPLTDWKEDSAEVPLVDTITDVTASDVDIMLNDWTLQVFQDSYEGASNPIDARYLFGGDGRWEMVREHLAKGALNPDEWGSATGWTTYKGKSKIDNRLLNNANEVARNESQDLQDLYIEEGIGAYITEQQKKGKFLRTLSSLLTPGESGSLFLAYMQNPDYSKNFDLYWNEIEKQIKLKETDANPRFHVGALEYAEDVISDSNDQGWVKTLFTDSPKDQSEWVNYRDIRLKAGEDLDKTLQAWVDSPRSFFSKENQLPPNTFLKDQLGDYAVDAKKLFLDEFEQKVWQAHAEARAANEFISVEELATITRTQAELFGQQWPGFLGQKQSEFEEKEALKQASENYDELIKSFANEGKAASSIDTWLGSTEIGEEDKKEFAKALSKLYPRSSFEKDQQQWAFGQSGISDTRDLIESIVMGLPEGTFSDWVDRGTIERIQGMEIKDALGEAETSKGRAARQRQGYAFSPLGDLKPFSAQRVDRETGMRIQETGSELMKNLHLYPQLVQNQILYGLNRPQQDIVSGYGRETTLPSGLFEGLPAPTRTSITGKKIEMPYGPPPGEYGSFDPSFIQMPDLTKPEYNFGGYNVSTEQPIESGDEGIIGVPIG